MRWRKIYLNKIEENEFKVVKVVETLITKLQVLSTNILIPIGLHSHVRLTLQDVLNWTETNNGDKKTHSRRINLLLVSQSAPV